MIIATWKGKEIARSNDTVVVENNHYFPEEDVHMELLKSTDLTTTCPWKGKASYYSIMVDDDVNKNAAWTYKEPKDAAKEIKNRIAFMNGVKVTKE